MKPLIVFSHGKESGPNGEKLTQLMKVGEEFGATCISIDYRPGMLTSETADQTRKEAARRVTQLLSTVLPPHGPLIFVGSSMGGYVSTTATFDKPVGGLFLLAPALNVPGYELDPNRIQANHICVIHGWNDDVIPADGSWKFCKEQRAELHMLDADHRLNSVIPELKSIFANYLSKILGPNSGDSSAERSVIQ